MYNLYCDFDIEMHKKTYINYLEVVIRADGTVEYAVPSHQEKLIKISCEKLGISRDELENSCPSEFWCDYLKWLCIQSGCVAVWNYYCQYESITTKQIVALRKLKNEGIYFGKVPELSRKKDGGKNYANL